MTDLKIGVILGSTRQGRNGKAVADWVVEQARNRSAATYELVDLLDYPLPHLGEADGGAAAQAWAEKIASLDGFVFVTPEYNHSISGVLKNALDHLRDEWHNKAAAFVSYGSVGGARAAEHLRGIAAELETAGVRQPLAFSLFSDFENFSTFKPGAPQYQSAGVMFGQLEAWAGALKPLRTEAAAA